MCKSAAEFQDDCNSVYDRKSFKDFSVTLVSILIQYSFSSSDPKLVEFYKNSLLPALQNLILNEDQPSAVVGALLGNKKDIALQNENLHSVLDYIIWLRQGTFKDDPAIIRKSKICLLNYPQNSYVRFLANCVFFHHEYFEGIFMYEEIKDTLDTKIFELFGARSNQALTEEQKLAKAKVAMVQHPEHPVFQEIVGGIRNNYGIYKEENRDNFGDKMTAEQVW